MAEEKAKADAERRARLAEQVKSTGLLKLLGAARAKRLDRRRARQGRRRPRPGEGVPGRRRRRRRERATTSCAASRAAARGSGKVATVGGLRGGGSIAEGGTGSAAAEKQVSGIVKTEAPAVDGELDPGMVAKEVRARQGAIKACYERALKRNPTLTGKIVMHWTITAAGTVSGVDVEQDSLGDSEVGELHQVAGRALALPGARGRLGRRVVPIRLPVVAVRKHGARLAARTDSTLAPAAKNDPVSPFAATFLSGRATHEHQWTVADSGWKP